MADKIKIRDTRKVDAVTGKAMTDTNRMHSEADSSMISDIIQGAKERKLDPYTALAIAMQETKFGRAEGVTTRQQVAPGLTRILTPMDDFAANPFHVNDNEMDDKVNGGLDLMLSKIKLAKKLGKTTDADVIQAWNGYGKIKGQGEDTPLLYGININTLPNQTMDMNANPVYGKRIIDLRDNVLKQHPEIQKMVKEIYGGEPVHATGEQIKEAMQKTGHTDPAEFTKWFGENKGKVIIPVD